MLKTDEWEKVSEGLECCLSGKHPIPCDKCRYFNDTAYNDVWSCRLSLMRDARSILEALRPRIMTYDEVITSEEARWLECVNGACGYAEIYPWPTWTDIECVEIHRINHLPEHLFIKGYGKVWRFWTSQPTFEQRKEAKWDE